MGFTKAKFQHETPISLSFRINNEDTGIVEDLVLTHVFRLPTARERDLYEQKRIQVKGRKIKHYAADARWFMWERCCLRVEDYDDLPEVPDPEDPIGKKMILDPAWKIKYFTDDVGRIMVDGFVDRFLEQILGDDVEFEKKPEPSLEQ